MTDMTIEEHDDAEAPEIRSEYQKEDEEREAELKKLCEELVVRMIRSGHVALSRFDGHEYCWFDLVPASWSGERIVLKTSRRPERIDYHIVSYGSEVGLFGILPIDEKEVYIPLPAAWALAGVEFDPSMVHAPEDWRRSHADWRRARWTKNARDDDVRIHTVRWSPEFREYKEERRKKGDLFGLENPGYMEGDIAIEGGPYSGAIAGWRDGQKIKFHKDHSCSLDPFTGGDYEDVDSLIADLHDDGRYVTDHRRVVGTVSDAEEVAARLRDGMLLEHDYRRWMLMPPRVDGRHEEFHYVPDGLVRRLEEDGTIVKVGRVAFRHGEGYEAYTLPELAAECARLCHKPTPPPVDRSPVLATDDDGRSITENDVVLESHRMPLDDTPLLVLPPFDYPGTEEEWDTEQLVERVRARRRSERKA